MLAQGTGLGGLNASSTWGRFVTNATQLCRHTTYPPQTSVSSFWKTAQQYPPHRVGGGREKAHEELCTALGADKASTPTVAGVREDCGGLSAWFKFAI